MGDPIATGEALYGSRRGRGLDLAFEVALFVTLPWRGDRFAAPRSREHRLGDVRQKAAREGRLRAAVEVPPKGTAQVQAVLGARYAHVSEPALFRHLRGGPNQRRVFLALIQRPLVGQQALFH